MKFSKKWLQKYIQETLPDDATLEKVITFNAFEVEGKEKYGDDTIFDIKILPNRAHDALGHRGMARDIAALFNLTFIDTEIYSHGTQKEEIVAPHIRIDDTKACTALYAIKIEGISVEESPLWLKEILESIGQKSINNIVDITNYVQFAINKPIHAYDADFVEGNLLVARFAEVGEKLITLDDKEIILDEKTLVIADSKKPLGLAGIKGGKYSGISSTTTSLILESAQFDASLIRKTSQKYGIRTDASKRFENGISDSLVDQGLSMAIALIEKICPKIKVSSFVQEGSIKKWEYSVSVSANEINGFLGISLTPEEIGALFTRLSFPYEIKTGRDIIESNMEKVKDAVYKRVSSMRNDAPHFFSCSSLMSYFYNGMWQPSISIDTYVYGEKVEKEKLLWGDLIFSNTQKGHIHYESVDFMSGTKVEEGIDHVGMYVGDGKVVHISQEYNAVVTESIYEAKAFQGKLLYARMLNVEEKRFFITVPNERRDIRSKEDLIEEIARVYGLFSIEGKLPVIGKRDSVIPLHKRLYYEILIKNILFGHGFSEVCTYTFGDEGGVSIIKSVSDKKKLRSTLTTGIQKAYTMNMYNAPLLSLSEIRIFECGNVFTKTEEKRHMVLCIDNGVKKSNYKEVCDAIISEIEKAIGTGLVVVSTASKPYTMEIDIDATISKCEEKKDIVFLNDVLKEKGMKARFTKISPYPFIVRDIAVWVDESVTFSLLKKEIEEVLHDDMHILALPITLFDSFTKEGRVSYAFRIVLQSHEKTLTDMEANEVSDKVYAYLKEGGYEVR